MCRPWLLARCTSDRKKKKKKKKIFKEEEKERNVRVAKESADVVGVRR